MERLHSAVVLQVLIILAANTHSLVCVRCRAQETVAVKKCTSCSVAQAAAAW